MSKQTRNEQKFKMESRIIISNFRRHFDLQFSTILCTHLWRNLNASFYQFPNNVNVLCYRMATILLFTCPHFHSQHNVAHLSIFVASVVHLRPVLSLRRCCCHCGHNRSEENYRKIISSESIAFFGSGFFFCFSWWQLLKWPPTKRKMNNWNAVIVTRSPE